MLNIDVSDNKDYACMEEECYNNQLLNILDIDWKEFDIIKKTDSKIEWDKLWLIIENPIPIYFLEWVWRNKWWYHPELKIIILYSNSDEETIKHEIIHSIEFDREKSENLISLYEQVKIVIHEDSFSESNGFVTFNFRKNIHEFIADWYSKVAFINAMKKEWLYEQFIQKTNYLFNKKKSSI